MLRFQCVCDHCGKVHDRGQHHQFMLSISAREHAQREGWLYTEDGSDVCPRCGQRVLLGLPPERRRLTG
jgi:hypothetical protein